MITRIMRRLDRCRMVDVRVLAVPDLPADDALVDLAPRCGWEVFRGDEQDVLGRYVAAAEHFRLDTVVRATGDNPLVDPGEADRLVAFHREQRLDYASNRTDHGSGLPVGTGVEVFSREALRRSHEEGQRPHHREHVNEYVEENPGLFRTAVLAAPEPLRAPELSFTVDVPEELELLGRIFELLGPDREPSLREVVAAARAGRLPMPGTVGT